MILTIYTSAKLECVEINDFDIQLVSWTLSTNICSQLFTVKNHLIQNTYRLLASTNMVLKLYANMILDYRSQT